MIKGVLGIFMLFGVVFVGGCSYLDKVENEDVIEDTDSDILLSKKDGFYRYNIKNKKLYKIENNSLNLFSGSNLNNANKITLTDYKKIYVMNLETEKIEEILIDIKSNEKYIESFSSASISEDGRNALIKVSIYKNDDSYHKNESGIVFPERNKYFIYNFDKKEYKEFPVEEVMNDKYKNRKDNNLFSVVGWDEHNKKIFIYPNVNVYENDLIIYEYNYEKNDIKKTTLEESLLLPSNFLLSDKIRIVTQNRNGYGSTKRSFSIRELEDENKILSTVNLEDVQSDYFDRFKIESKYNNVANIYSYVFSSDENDVMVGLERAIYKVNLGSNKMNIIYEDNTVGFADDNWGFHKIVYSNDGRYLFIMDYDKDENGDLLYNLFSIDLQDGNKIIPMYQFENEYTKILGLIN